MHFHGTAETTGNSRRQPESAPIEFLGTRNFFEILTVPWTVLLLLQNQAMLAELLPIALTVYIHIMY